MSDATDAQSDRDTALIRVLCGSADNFRRSFQEWIQEELRDLRVTIQSLVATTDGTVRENLLQELNWLKDIDAQEFPDLIKSHKNRVNQAFVAIYDNPFEVFILLEEGGYRLEKMARILFRMRRTLRELARPSDQTPND